MNTEIIEFKLGDFVFVGLAHRQGAGFYGVINNIKTDPFFGCQIFVKIDETMFGDRIIKTEPSNVSLVTDYQPTKEQAKWAEQLQKLSMKE